MRLTYIGRLPNALTFSWMRVVVAFIHNEPGTTFDVRLIAHAVGQVLLEGLNPREAITAIGMQPCSSLGAVSLACGKGRVKAGPLTLLSQLGEALRGAIMQVETRRMLNVDLTVDWKAR